MRKKITRAENISRVIVAIPPIHHYPSRKEWEIACWEKISRSPDFLCLIATSHERHDLVMRAAAMDRILSGKSYTDIGKELWLSSQTVSGIQKAARANIYTSYLERSKKERKKKIYSSPLSVRKEKSSGTRRRTKYGTLYLPV